MPTPRTKPCRLAAPLAALLLATPLLTGCGMSQPISYEGIDRGGSSFFLLGLWNVFSKGLDDVAADLQAHGYHGHSMPGPEWKALCAEIIRLDKSGELRRPLVLSGHSLGADKALMLSEELGEHGVEVDYVLLLDATNPGTVPANVKRCHNIYLSHPATDWFPAFRGIAVQADSPETELVNYDVRISTDERLSSGDFNHFNIETDPEVQQLMVDLIRAQFDGVGDVAAVFPPVKPDDAERGEGE